MPRFVCPGRMARAAALAVLAGALTVAVSGCDPGATRPSPSAVPSTSHAPVFASDAEALKAAEEAYGKYSALSDQISARGGKDPDAIRSFVGKEFGDQLVEEFKTLESGGLHTEGEVKFDTGSLVERSESGAVARVSIYVCRDVSGTRVIDSVGRDVTKADRVGRQPLQLFLSSSPHRARNLIVDRIDIWPGRNFC